MDKNQAAVAIFNKLAVLYQEKYMDTSAYHDTFDLFCESIKKENASVLEVACGPGNITKYLLEKRPDFKILATDLAPNMVDLAKKNNPMAEFEVMDCREIARFTKKFDALMCGFAFPYLSKEEVISFIEAAAKILNPEGVLYLSTMEDDYSKSEYKRGSTGDEIFMYFHEATYLSETLIANHFDIISLKRQEFQYQDGTKNTDLVIIASLKLND